MAERTWPNPNIFPWITLVEYPWPSDLWPIENGHPKHPDPNENGHPKPPGPNELLVTLAEYTWPN